jgi:hypothetical protein
MPFLFIPGFACPTSAYAAFLAALHERGVSAAATDPSQGLLAQIMGRSRPEDEAQRVAPVLREVEGAGPVVLGGHSRGALVAYRAAAVVQPAALVLVDPVSGGGPPWRNPEPLPPVEWRGPSLVLGCDRGGRCAPEGRNHEIFAAMLTNCVHDVVRDCGHADILDGRFRAVARFACAGGSDPDRARDEIAQRVAGFLHERSLSADS